MHPGCGNNVDQPIDQLISAVRTSRGSVATAESLTGGQLAAAISAAPGASEWYRGGIVAYQSEVKHTLLETPPGPVVTHGTAAAMACSVAKLLDARYTVALTGVGGPGFEEGKAPGTVFIATYEAGHAPVVDRHEFDGVPVEVVEQTVSAALHALIKRIQGAHTTET